jgi:hypothetical protein
VELLDLGLAPFLGTIALPSPNRRSPTDGYRQRGLRLGQWVWEELNLRPNGLSGVLVGLKGRGQHQPRRLRLTSHPHAPGRTRMDWHQDLTPLAAWPPAPQKYYAYRLMEMGAHHESNH